MSDVKKINVVFVCMGNICRSPTAEGVFRHVVKNRNLQDRVNIDSAGTHAYHIGESPDSRAQSTAKSRGIDLASQRARKFEAIDFDHFDYVIAMDRSNFENLKALSTPEKISKLHLFMDFSKEWDEAEVPDPYYGGVDGFTKVFDMVQSASEGLLEVIVKDDL